MSAPFRKTFTHPEQVIAVMNKSIEDWQCHQREIQKQGLSTFGIFSRANAIIPKEDLLQESINQQGYKLN
jgi:hypothetical protein